MGQKIIILNLEDDPNDAELNQHMIEADGMVCEMLRVETRTDFVAALQNGVYDIILADYSLPSFDGLAALELARERCPDVPFIFVSGALGEEVAIEALKKGATDYVLKDRLSRLASAVRRALKERDQKAERERAEKIQREQGEFLRTVFEAISHPFYVVDAQSHEIVMANSATRRPASQERLLCYAFTHGTDHPCNTTDHPCPLERLKVTRQPAVVEHVHVTPQGIRRVVEVHGYPVLDKNGSVVQMIEYCVDITDRRRLEEAMRSILEGTSSVVGTNFFRKLVFHLTHTLGLGYALVAVVDGDSKRMRTLAIWAKGAYADNVERGLANTPFENVWREGFCRFPERVQQLFPQDHMLAEMGVEGFLGAALRASSGEVLGLLAVMDDRPLPNVPFAEDLLTIFSARAATELERQSAEQALARLATVVEQAAEDIVIADTSGRITYVNPAFENTMGYTRSEIEGHSAEVLVSGAQDSAFYRALSQSVGSGAIWTGRITNRSKDGRFIDEDATISPIRDPNGKQIGYVAIMRDVTERLSLEAQLRQAQKMEAIGTLAGGIAHDFNNILAAISGNIDLALEDAPAHIPELRECLTEAMKASERATDLVHQILTFSRQSQPERKPIYVDSLVKEVAKFLRATIPATIEIEWRVPATPLMVFADLIQLHQVLMNLCTNAYHAMREKGGKLFIELTEETEDPSHPQVGPRARITVRDTGIGMDADTISRIFDPFFTTKPQGEGTGLGLSVVHGIVESHGGSIRVSSEVGKGSTFDVFLPLWRGEQPEDDDGAVPLVAGGHGERILLVDDEEAVLNATRRRLSRLGYYVVTSMDSRRALETFRAEPGAFDLVITDQTMPHLTGLDMADEMLRLRPSCPIILYTGYSDRTTEAEAKERGVRELLRKPVKTRTLAKAVALALGSYQREDVPEE